MHRSTTTTAVVIGAILIPTGGSMVNGDFAPLPEDPQTNRASYEVRFVSDSARTTLRFQVPTTSLTDGQLASIARGTDDGKNLWDWPDA